MTNTDLRDVVGRNIAYARKKCGLSQLELALRLQVTQKQISYWETGRHTPTIEHIQALSKLLGVPPFAFYMKNISEDFFNE